MSSMNISRPPRYIILIALFNLILGINLIFGTGQTIVTYNGSMRFDKVEQAKIIPVGKGGALAFVYVEIKLQVPGWILLRVQELVNGFYQHTIRTEIIKKTFREFIPINRGITHQLRISNILNQTVIFEILVRYHPAMQAWSYFGLLVGIPLLLVAYPIVRLSDHLETIQGRSFRAYSPIGKKARVPKESRKATLPVKNKK